MHACEPTPYHVGREFVSTVSKVLPALSGRGKEISRVSGRTVHARSVYYEYSESVSSPNTGGSYTDNLISNK